MLLSTIYSSPLREVRQLAQRDNEGFRRWFTSPTADLFVWYAEGDLNSFEFCYDKPRRERSVRWSEVEGLRFFEIDDGEGSPVRNRTPIAIANETGDRERAAGRLEALSAYLEAQVFRYVLSRIWLGQPRYPAPDQEVGEL